MKHLSSSAACVAGALLLGAVAAQAADGRYQAVPIDPGQGFGADKVLILDTVSGNLWIWIESPAVEDDPGGRFIIYQGQLAPGQLFDIDSTFLASDGATPLVGTQESLVGGQI